MSDHSLHLIACGASSSVGARTDPNVSLPKGLAEYRLLFCQSGQVIFRFADHKAYIAKKGDVILFSPMEAIEYRLGAQHHVTWVRFTGSDVPQWLSPVFDASPVCSLGALPLSIRRCLDDLASERYLSLWESETACSAHLTLLFTYLKRASRKISPTPPSEFSKLLPAVAAMEEEFALCRPIEEYAKMCRLSEYYFIRFFRQYKGISPAAYRTKCRIDRACVLLASTNQSIAQIADSVGYADSAQFCKQFKAQLGQTPLAYRKEQKV